MAEPTNIPTDLIVESSVPTAIPQDLVPEPQAAVALPADLQPLPDLAPGIPAPTEQEASQIGQSIKFGIQQQLGPSFVRILQRAGVNKDTIKAFPLEIQQPLQAAFNLTEALRPKDDFIPTTTAEKVTAGITSFIDPALIAIAGPAEILLAPRALAAIGLTGKATKLARLARVAKQGEALGLSSAAFKKTAGEINRRILLNQFASVGIRAGIGGAAAEAAITTAVQVERGELDLGEIAARTAIAGGAGLVAGPLLQAGGRALARRGQAAATKKIRLADGDIDPKIIDVAKQRSEATAKRLVARGAIPETSQGVTSQKLFLESLERQGINQGNIEVSISKIEEGFLGSIEIADKIDRKVGTRVTESIQRVIEGEFEKSTIRSTLRNQFGKSISNLETKGVGRKEITNLMQYVETLPSGEIRFNPAARQITSRFSRAQFKGTLPDAAVMEDLTSIRQTFNSIFENNPELAQRAGFIDGYVPIIRKQAGLRAADIRPGSTKQVEEAFFLQRRVHNSFNTKIHEQDFAKLADFYSKAAANHVAFNKHLPQIYGELTKLRWMGRSKEAQLISKKLMRAMGIRNNVDINRIFGNEVANANDIVLQELAEQTVAPRRFLDEAREVMRKVTFDTLVFQNPRTILKQSIQPELVGSGEIGFKWIRKGRSLSRLNKQARKEADAMMDLMRSKDPGNFAELEFDQSQNKFLRFIEKASDIGAKPGKFLFNKLDIENRRVAFLGAREQFRTVAAGDLEGVLDGLLAGEKNIVRRSLEKDGAEAAANSYGLLRSRRVNYAYGIADTPEAFAEGLGRFVPFTTWGRNQLSRVVGDVRGGNIKRLAARVAKPLAFLTAFKVLTGYTIPGAHPLLAVGGPFSATPMPAIAEVAEAVRRARDFPGAVKAVGTAVKQFTPAAPIERAIKRLDKTDDLAESFFNLRKTDKRSFSQKFRNEIFR